VPADPVSSPMLIPSGVPDRHPAVTTLGELSRTPQDYGPTLDLSQGDH
jgi:hypothetical protein